MGFLLVEGRRRLPVADKFLRRPVIEGLVISENHCFDGFGARKVASPERTSRKLLFQSK